MIQAKRAYIGTIEEIKANVLSNDKVSEIIEIKPIERRDEHIIYYYGEVIQNSELKEKKKKNTTTGRVMLL